MYFPQIIKLATLVAGLLPLAFAAPVETEDVDIQDLLPRQAPPPVGDQNFQNCGGLSTLITSALKEVQLLSAAAAAYDPNGKYFQAWFGSSSQKDINRIQKRYTTLSKWLSAPDRDLYFNCRTQGSDICDKRSSIAAYANKGGSIVNFCPTWFKNPGKRITTQTPPSGNLASLSLDTYNTKSAQLLHEMTHALYRTDDHNITVPVSSTYPLGLARAYSHENTLTLAQQDPVKAKDNADSYAYFAMAAFWSRSNWSINPNKIVFSHAAGDL